MVHVTFWLLLFLAISLLGQSNAVSDQCGELQKEIARIRELNRRSELLLGQCYEQLKTETHVSEAAFRSLELAEDEFKSKLQHREQSEADNNDLKKQIQALQRKLQKSHAAKNTLEKQLQDKDEALQNKTGERERLQTVIDGLRKQVASLKQTATRKCLSTFRVCIPENIWTSEEVVRKREHKLLFTTSMVARISSGSTRRA